VNEDELNEGLREARNRQSESHNAAADARSRRRAAAMKEQLEQSLRNLGVADTSPIARGHRVGAASSASSSPAAPMSESRLIREQQEREYADALQRDREKAATAERLAAAKADAELAEAMRLSRLSALAESVPPEPDASCPPADVCTLVLRWNDGTRTDRRFSADAPLATVLAFVESRNRHQPTETVALVASYPRRVLTDVDLSLRQLGLVPNSVLFVDFVETE
jgi:hypothetical protein